MAAKKERNVADEIAERDTPPPRPSCLLHPLDVIEINGIKIDLNYYFTNEYIDIGQASQELPNVIELVNWQLQLLYEDKLNAAQELAQAEAQAFFDLKGGTFNDLYNAKPTDKSLQHAVNNDEGVIKAWRNLNRLSGWVRRFDSLQKSLTTKLDMIRSSEATRRRLVEPAELELDRRNGREERED